MRKKSIFEQEQLNAEWGYIIYAFAFIDFFSMAPSQRKYTCVLFESTETMTFDI